MTRDLFLKKRYRKLKWRRTRKETRDTVHVYCELFDREQAQGRSEPEICEKWGAPTQLTADLIHTQPQQDHRPLLYKVLFFVGLTCLLFFPVLSLHGTVYRALWSWQEGLRYLYIPLMPLASVALFRLEHIWEIPFKKTPMTTRIFYGTAPLALLVCAVCSFGLYTVMIQQSQNGPMLYNFLAVSIWLIAGIWVLSTLFGDACGRYFPYVYFIYAFCITTLSRYAESISSMSLLSPETAPAAILASTFREVPLFALLALVGALLWFVYARYQKATRVLF